VLDIRHDFSDYSVILLPVAMLITDANIAKLEEFIKNGGTVIASFRAGLKEYHNEIRFGVENPIHKLANVSVNYFEPLPTDTSCTVNYKGQGLKATVWRDMLIPKENTQSLCSYTDEFKDYSGAVKSKVGSGEIYYIGTGIDDEIFWNDITMQLADEKSLQYFKSPDSLEIVIKGDDDNKIAILMNHNRFEVEYLGETIKALDTQVIAFDDFKNKYAKHHA
jgi:beta-galactosidase